ncbi:MAG TPA: 5-oxoprolinase subunit PxpB [Desulfobacteraceae bacterium]|nr:5-oxoprolinase subunit PxpB [Deltaproteobacteria bacterium]MBW2357083.1 5-oxoprolinase subunit PxpB [Deltaproteobacteria bacterium]RLB98906.1 MAG: allophanate hydrolase [Deltaproteobacteria bacterium]HDI59474.1 5-oxoprolinase subunit PxpB [Desulfobacteraceae bacterium]
MREAFYDRPRFRACGDRALLAEYGTGIDLAVNRKVHAVAAALRERSLAGIEAVIPAYRNLAVIYDPIVVSFENLTAALTALESDLETAEPAEPRTVDIPVCYGGRFGPDLAFVAEHNQLTVEEVVRIHSQALYPIYAVGFAPGFCYLGGLDPRLHTPRLPTPRTRVPAGSVGIAEAQTGVYPSDSPGGWRLVGRTPLRLFNPSRADPFLYQAGDQIRFVPVSEPDFHRLRAAEEP